MNRGFVTVATGKDKYYVLAHNLLISYRYHSPHPMPFAILCDRHNDWTDEFDQVVIIENPACAFIDKMRIINLSPFDETIFIDADCLAYRDLNGLWNLFKDSPDFGLLGDVHQEEMWWKKDNLGELRDKVRYNLTCQGGIYYVRNNGDDIRAFADTCSYIKERYWDFKFIMFPRSISDEQVFTLASAAHGFIPVRPWRGVIAYYPLIKSLDMDIRAGSLVCEFSDYPGEVYRDSFILHFGTKAAINEWLYSREVFKLRKRPLKMSDRVNMALVWIRCMAIKVWRFFKPLVPQKIIDMIFRGERFSQVAPLSTK